MNWFPLVISLFVGFMAGRKVLSAFKYGRVGVMFSPAPRTREDDPAFFWGVVAFWVFIILVCIYRIANL